MRRASAVVCAGLVLTGASLAAQRARPLPFTAADADLFEQKVARIQQNGSAAARGHVRIETEITEPEVNAYLRYRVQAQLPAGVVDPVVLALGDGRLLGSATVDLDVVRESKARGWFDPMRLLRGRLPVTAAGVLRTGSGAAQFELDAARVNGVAIPNVVLQELITFYTRSPAFPAGLDIDAPFALPAGILEVAVLAGRAIVLQ